VCCRLHPSPPPLPSLPPSAHFTFKISSNILLKMKTKNHKHLLIYGTTSQLKSWGYYASVGLKFDKKSIPLEQRWKTGLKHAFDLFGESVANFFLMFKCHLRGFYRNKVVGANRRGVHEHPTSTLLIYWQEDIRIEAICRFNLSVASNLRYKKLTMTRPPRPL